jgi:hypothetical protein
MNIDQETGESIVVSLSILCVVPEISSHELMKRNCLTFMIVLISTLVSSASEGALASVHPVVGLFRFCYHYHGKLHIGGECWIAKVLPTIESFRSYLVLVSGGIGRVLFGPVGFRLQQEV